MLKISWNKAEHDLRAHENKNAFIICLFIVFHEKRTIIQE